MNTQEIILSGILEGYALEGIEDQKMVDIEKLILENEEIAEEVKAIRASLDVFVYQFKMTPPSQIKENILNVILDEQTASLPPILNEESKISDYQLWLEKVEEPAIYDNMHMEVIGEYECAKMVIAWIRNGEEDHSHSDYDENFLIVEGNCTATIGEETNDYGPGEYISFPVNISHRYQVTSKMPMKVVACLDMKAS